MNAKKIIVIVLGIVLVFGLYFTLNMSTNLEKTVVKNIFVDINGDGMTDLLLTGDVILNNGTANFPLQPTNSQP